jgi:hypothetical protein
LLDKVHNVLSCYHETTSCSDFDGCAVEAGCSDFCSANQSREMEVELEKVNWWLKHHSAEKGREK